MKVKIQIKAVQNTSENRIKVKISVQMEMSMYMQMENPGFQDLPWNSRRITTQTSSFFSTRCGISEELLHKTSGFWEYPRFFLKNYYTHFWVFGDFAQDFWRITTHTSGFSGFPARAKPI